MSSQQDRSGELDRLLENLCEERLSEPERQRLNALLREGEEARWRYLTEVHMHAALSYLSGLPEVRIQPDERHAARSLVVFDVLGDAFRQGIHFLSNGLVASLLLAVGLPAFLLGVLVLGVIMQPPPETPVATLTRSHDAVGHLSGSLMPLSAGMDIFPGQELVLDEGLVEIRFGQGTKALVEAPTSLRIAGRNAGFLWRGRLAATVPTEAHGFTVDTPCATVVDLGTDLGVSVAADGTAEAHVFKGKVEVAAKAASGATRPTPIATRQLGVGEAVQVHVPEPGKPPRIIAMTAAPERFTRQFLEDMPRPTILFAHRGGKNPVNEGWQTRGTDKHDPARAGIEVGPVDEDGVSAWSLRTRKDNRLAYYTIEKADGLTPELLAEAKQKGWVLRARVWLSERNRIPPKKWKGLAGLAYRDGERGWTIRPSVDADGNQCLMIYGHSSVGFDTVVPIPGSRNRYVDYEVRYRPRTRDAEVFINGHRVATWSRDGSRGEYTSPPQVRFGGWRPAIDARFALVEWGILRGSPTTTGPNVEPNSRTDGAESPANVHEKSDRNQE